MAKYRIICPNPDCKHQGPKIGESTGGYVKPHFADLNTKKHGAQESNPRLLLRCPICKHRWRARSNTLQEW